MTRCRACVYFVCMVASAKGRKEASQPRVRVNTSLFENVCSSNNPLYPPGGCVGGVRLAAAHSSFARVPCVFTYRFYVSIRRSVNEKRLLICVMSTSDDSCFFYLVSPGSHFFVPSCYSQATWITFVKIGDTRILIRYIN